MALRSVSTSAGRRVSFEVVPPGLVGSFASRALKAIKPALPLGGRYLVRSGSSGPGPSAFAGGPARTCWKALRAQLSGPLSLHYRWAVGVPSGRDPLAQDSRTARSWSLPAGALEYREPSPGDCVVIAKVPEGVPSNHSVASLVLHLS